jgi:hypothetical protein
VGERRVEQPVYLRRQTAPAHGTEIPTQRDRLDFDQRGALYRYICNGNVVLQERNEFNVPQASLTRGLDLSGALQIAGGIGRAAGGFGPAPSIRPTRLVSR